MVFLCGCGYKLVKIPIFFQKYLVMSKKSSTFALAFVEEWIFQLVKWLKLLDSRIANMVAIAQLAEHRIVVPSVVGSSPTSHPKKDDFGRLFLYICCVFKKKQYLCAFLDE